MGWMRRLWQRAKLTRERFGTELDEEMQFHVEEATRANREAGMGPEEARYAALRRFGNVGRMREDSRGVWLVPALEALLQDLRYGARMLRKNPGFTAVAVLTLALGIGANTAIFSMVNAALIKPLPYRDPASLVNFAGSHSLPDVADLAVMCRSFEQVGAFSNWGLDLVGRGAPERVDAALVGGNLFAALGVDPYLGTTFSEEDDRAHKPVVVVSYGFWQRTLNPDRNAVGRALTFSGQRYTVAGVMPLGFKLPNGMADVWVPFRVGYPEAAEARGAHFMFAIARLRPGVSLPQAQSELDAVGKRLGEMHPIEARTFRVQPLRDRVVTEVKTPLLVLLAAVGCVLLIACSNFANLLLARVAARAREMQVRSALGAGRWRLARQLLTESVLLSVLGGVGGLALAKGGVELLLRLKPKEMIVFHSVEVDAPTFAFALALSLLTGVVFGLAPAIQVWMGGSTEMGGRVTGKSALRRALVVLEMATALVLLVSAGLLLRSFWELRKVDLGMQPERVLTMRVSLPAQRYASIPQQVDFLRRLNQSLQAGTGVESAGLISELPLSGWRMMHNMAFQDRVYEAGKEPEIGTHEVSPAYFKAIGTPLLLGRGFSDQDREDTPLVGVVNQAMAHEFWPDKSPIGAQVTWARMTGPPRWITIVGVVSNVKFDGLDQQEMPTIYTPFTQKLQVWKRFTAIVARTRSGEPMEAAADLRQRVWQLDDQLPVTDVEPMTLVVAESISSRRFQMTLLLVFAGLALALAVIGIYGVISYLVTQRTREIGIRMALGAQRRHVVGMVVRQGLGLTLVGVGLGVAGALAAVRTLEKLLFGVSATDPVTFATMVAILAGVALAASYIPARRASRIDPVVALRYE